MPDTAHQASPSAAPNSLRSLDILLLTPSLPYPPIWGFGIRVYQLIRALSRRHRVTLLTYSRPGEDEQENIAVMREICAAVQVVPSPGLPGGKRREQLLSLFSPLSYQTSSLRSQAMQETLTRLLTTQHFDLVQVESSQLAGFDFGREVPVILDEHNLEYELLQRLYQGERAPVRRLYNWAEFVKFRREEQACWRKAAACLLTSGREEEILTGLLPGKPATTIPNGVDIEFYQPTPETPTEPDSLIFTGLMTYRPNIDGAIYFVEEVLPLIHKTRPGVTLKIVGAGAGEEIAHLAGPSVTMTGAVPDMRVHFAAAALAVVPLRMGSGTRLKVVEGLAMGKPMVSTSVGCEGIHVRSEEHLLIADTPATFAEAVLRILTDLPLAETLSRQGRSLVESEYGWGSIAGRLEAFYAQVLAD